MTEKKIKLWAMFISLIWIVAAFLLNWIFTLAIEKASTEETAAKLLQLSYSFCVLCVLIIEVVIIDILIIKAFLEVKIHNVKSIVFLISLLLGIFVLFALPSLTSIEVVRNYITRDSSRNGRTALLLAICSPACLIKYFLYQSLLIEKFHLQQTSRK